MRENHVLLIVDDNASNRRVLSNALQKPGYRTVEASDGYVALDVVEQHRPDLILLDIRMPGRDGYRVCELLKADPRAADVPVIFLTAKRDRADIERAFAVGGSDYIVKPFNVEEVLARVSVHLRLQDAICDLRETHAQLLRAQKLESIGQLAAGIAHEINTPTQFVGDNARFLKDTFDELLPLLHETCAWIGRNDEMEGGEAESALRKRLRDADLEYWTEEIPAAIDQSLEGIERISRIVQAMKEFSHPGVKEMIAIDLNRAIESTITVGASEWKYVASLETDFDADLPPVTCSPGEFNQVILNMIINAAHAIADVIGDDPVEKGTIRITTRRKDDVVEIRIADTGKGIPEMIVSKIFDPFFTTKEVGKGTGQGLAVAHDVVVNRHGGRIRVDTKPGRGTTFFLELPLEQAKTVSPEAA